MCLLTFLPAGVQPDLAALHTGTWHNQDGHGFAIVTDAGILVRRSMNPAALIDAFAVARRDHPDGPALFHSRFATHGTETLDNCHPFPVGGDMRTVLAHNGVLPAAVQPNRHDPRSDTRIAAEDFLPRFGPLRLRRNRLTLERWMTPQNKMVLLTVDRRYRQRAYLLNEHSGVWDGGIWYSNSGYQPDLDYPGPYPWPVAGIHARTWGWDDTPDLGCTIRCTGCGTLIDATEPECPICGWCLDCGQLLGACICYTPTRGPAVSAG